MSLLTPPQPSCYIGLTQWQHSAWQETVLTRGRHQHILNAYSRHFSSVEGNSTFYGLPKADTVKQWKKEAADHFHFCFKFPQLVTHERQLQHSLAETTEFLNRISILESKLGLLCIQLPESFSYQNLDSLSDFLKTLPHSFEYAVEVRNLCFFNKGKEEKALNQILSKYKVNRISFDTRPLFANTANDSVSLKAKKHKPKLPVHALTTGNSPMIRFISAQDWQSSIAYLEPWINKTVNWIAEGKTPYFFFHTPDNAEAPELARFFVHLLEQKIPGCCFFNPWIDSDKQSTLF